MKSFTAHIKRVSLAVIALLSVGLYQSALALPGETSAGLPINNTANVDYRVGGVVQTQVSSLPASFTVDRKVLFTVNELSGGFTQVTPGQTNAVTAFTVTNTGNGSEGFQLTTANLATASVAFTNSDNQDMLNIRVFVDANGNNTYDPGTDSATSIDTLTRDTPITVFIVADTTVAGYIDGQFANVQLTARAAVAGTGAATLETNSGADTIGGAADVVIAVAGNSAAAVDQYAVQSARLNVAKSSVVITDPINCTTPGLASSCTAPPKAIPQAVIEYTIVVTNTSTVNSTDATLVVVSDTLVANLTYVPGSISKVGGTAAAPTNANVVGQVVTVPVGTLEDTNTTVGSAPGSNTATVKFRVTLL